MDNRAGEKLLLGRRRADSRGVSLLRRIDPHALVALAATIASLAVSALTLGERGDTYTVTTGSVTAKAAVADDGRPSAERFPVGGPAMQAAIGVAAGYWGTNACNGDFTVTWEPMDRMTNATASWRNPTDAWNNPGENFDCEIRFNTEADYDWQKFCSVMAHEIGHLAGKDHTSDQRDVMSPVYSEPLGECVASAEPGAPVAAPAVSRSKPIGQQRRAASASKKAAARKAAAKRRAVKRRARAGARAAQRIRARMLAARNGRGAHAFSAGPRYTD